MKINKKILVFSITTIFLLTNAFTTLGFLQVKEKNNSQTLDIPTPPVASFTYTPKNPCCNEEITLDASTSTDDKKNCFL